MNLALALVCLALVAVALALAARLRAARREAFIRDFVLPMGLFEKLRERRPQLQPKDCQLVARGLRQFFLAYLRGGQRYVSMPSQVVDDLWHEFILHTRAYERFCRQAFGGFLHHTPAVALGAQRRSNEGLRRCWWQVCREESINPRRPSRLPLLFALDAKLGIADGFFYAADCAGLRRAKADEERGVVNCGGDFASSGFDGGTAGFGDGDGGTSSSSGGSDGGDAGGGGDSGCGGGGCGGGD